MSSASFWAFLRSSTCSASCVASRSRSSASLLQSATLQQQLGEANTALRGKEEEYSKLTEERDRLVAKLAEQTKALKAAQQEAKAKEVDLLTEFETERAAWADKEAQMTACFSSIEDLVDDKPYSLSFLL